MILDFRFWILDWVRESKIDNPKSKIGSVRCIIGVEGSPVPAQAPGMSCRGLGHRRRPNTTRTGVASGS